MENYLESLKPLSMRIFQDLRRVNLFETYYLHNLGLKYWKKILLLNLIPSGWRMSALEGCGMSKVPEDYEINHVILLIPPPNLQEALQLIPFE
ncbi:unnamed protein product [Rodentolepis nana]|uniref:Uncharacterized protein n=1 Tax=Rodentolepis nana TaxID=102285 RepID=A0A0R3TLL5_RODNA|nr:unnamed protein product [Rodentolepis nana]